VFTHVVGKNLKIVEGKWKINLLGEYNIGGDGFEVERILEAVGITVAARRKSR